MFYINFTSCDPRRKMDILMTYSHSLVYIRYIPTCIYSIMYSEMLCGICKGTRARTISQPQTRSPLACHGDEARG